MTNNTIKITVIVCAYNEEKTIGNKEIIYVSLMGLMHPTKIQKYPFKQSIPEYVSAAKQIAQTVMINFTFATAIIRNIFIR